MDHPCVHWNATLLSDEVAQADLPIQEKLHVLFIPPPKLGLKAASFESPIDQKFCSQQYFLNFTIKDLFGQSHH